MPPWTAACPGVRRCAFGHVGDGNMHYNPIKPVDWDGRALSRAAPAPEPYRARHRRRPCSGSISAEHGVGRSRLAELEHYKQPIELDMMRSLKRALDPNGIMNPGKILRG